MKILYINAIPPPVLKGTDGVFNEIEFLCTKTNGDLIGLSPFRHVPSLIPPGILGIRYLFHNGGIFRNADIIHVFFPYPSNFLFLKNLSEKVVYTVSARMLPRYLNKSIPRGTIVMSTMQEADLFADRGHQNVGVIRPGIDLSLIRSSAPPQIGQSFTLLAGSAPWTREQFETKGFNLLLRIMKHLPSVRLICLWRGALYREWSKKIHAAGLSDRVEIINEKADISNVLFRCHAAIVLASRGDEVKSFPNSLMESIVGGRPVIISRAIPMSYFVEYSSCGTVVENLNEDELIEGINTLIDNYEEYAGVAERVGRRDLSAERMFLDYMRIYKKLHNNGNAKDLADPIHPQITAEYRNKS